MVISRTAQGEAQYDAICKRMCDLCSCPAGMENLSPHSYSLCHGYSQELVQDNWWHCRRLLQMLKQQYSISNADYHQHKSDLMMTLAAIEGGSSDPLPWLITLDGVLKSLCRACRSQSLGLDGKGQTIHERAIGEFVLFAHGTAIVAVSRRFRLNDSERPSRRQDFIQWYTMLYRLNPCCANRQCLQLLLNPSFIHALYADRRPQADDAFLQGTFSVSVRDKRLRSLAVQSFISSNWLYGYTCLSSLMSFREAHLALVGVLYWYAELCHINGCKAARGKWSTNF
jgi:hypothetical protein